MVDRVGAAGTAFSIPDPSGLELFGFDAVGRHAKTTTLPVGSTVATLAYDPSGILATVTDANANVTTLQRDGAGKPTSIVGPFGVTTALQIGSDGYLASVTDPTGATHQMTYQSGLLETIQFPTGSPSVRSTKTYDSLGRVMTSADAAGGTLTFSRGPDALSRVQVGKTTSMNVATGYAIAIASDGSSTWTNTLPDGTISKEQLGVDGSRTVTAPDGTRTTYVPGPDPRFGMQVAVPSSQTVVTPLGLTQTSLSTRVVTLNSPGDPLSLTAETDTTTVNGNAWSRAFNASTRTWTTTSPLGRLSTTVLDAVGRPTQVSIPNVSPFVTTYDARGRVQMVAQGSRTWTMGYDANGYLASVQDPLSNTVAYGNDLAGRPTVTVLADARQVSTSFDGDGNVTSMTLPSAQPSGPSHALLYTAVDLLQTYTPPSAGSGTWSTQYQYDLDRRLSLETRPDGATLTPGYDNAGRLLTIQVPQGTLARTYDTATGKLKTLAAPGGETLTYGYDGFLRTSVTWSGPVTGSLTFGFDSNFRMNAQAVNASSLSFGYDADGLLTQAGAMAVTRDPQNGRIVASSLGSVTDATAYDSNGLVASYVAKFQGTTLYSESIDQRYAGGRIQQRTETVQGATHVWGYTYDATGRLTDVTRDLAFFSHYEYDVNDNRTTWTGPSGTVSAVYDAQDRLVTYGGATYSYTANGELARKTAGSQATRYTYDVFENLLNVTPAAGAAIDYVVDGENRRVGKKVGGTLAEGFLYQDALNVVAQLDGSGNVAARYVFGTRPNVPDYLTSGAGTFRILSDHLGSPRVVVNASTGAVVEQIDYDEFGVVLSDTSPGLTPFGFAGGLHDSATGLVRFGKRDYDPNVGRWTSKDPLRFGGGQGNLYVYARNDAINRIDPTGLYGTNDCSYYAERCAENHGSYYCSSAPFWCNSFFPRTPDPDPSNDFDNEGWARCTRQCLQDSDRKRHSSDPVCEGPNDSGPWNPFNRLFDDHVKCYMECFFDNAYDW